MTSYTDPLTEWEPARVDAAWNARLILGGDADAFDIVTLAEFLLGHGNAQPATAVATPAPWPVIPITPAPVDDAEATPARFDFSTTGGLTVLRCGDGSYLFTVNGRSIALDNDESAELTRLVRG